MGPEMPVDEGSPADEFKKRIESKKAETQALFAEFMKHATEYQVALGLSDEDLLEVERQQASTGAMFPTSESWLSVESVGVDTGGEHFGLVVKNVCKHPYGKFSVAEGWQLSIMAIAKNPGLNREDGHGTSWVNVVPEEWHQRIIQHLTGQSTLPEDIDFSNITPEDIIGYNNPE